LSKQFNDEHVISGLIYAVLGLYWWQFSSQ